jgi:putative oxidoreductase
MLDAKSLSTKWAPTLLSVLRIVTALLFMQHGLQKLFGIPIAPPSGTVELTSLLGVAAVLELFGGLLVMIGLFTRPVAFILSGEMAVAYFYAHASQSVWPILNKGELSVLYCFVFLYIWAAGAGPWSVERPLSDSDS